MAGDAQITARTRPIFLVNVPICAATLAAAAFLLPSDVLSHPVVLAPLLALGLATETYYALLFAKE